MGQPELGKHTWPAPLCSGSRHAWERPSCGWRRTKCLEDFENLFLKNLQNFFDKLRKAKRRIIYSNPHMVSNFLSIILENVCCTLKEYLFKAKVNFKTTDLQRPMLSFYLSWSRVGCCPQRGSRPRYRPRYPYILRPYRSVLGKI